MHLMNWKKLETFKVISNFKSFNEASRMLKKTQSSFSRDILNLEKDLGFKLFNRTARGVKITEKGEYLLNIVREFDKKLTQISK
jgi:DNA-binding transcriptional LysR family regulator